MGKQERRLFRLAIGYLILFLIVIAAMPLYIRNEVIFQVGSVLLTVEGIFVALAPEIRNRSARNFTVVGLGVPSLLVSVITITLADFQSVQLQFLSTDVLSILFRIDAGLFAILVEVFAAGVLLQSSEGEHSADGPVSKRGPSTEE